MERSPFGYRASDEDGQQSPRKQAPSAVRLVLLGRPQLSCGDDLTPRIKYRKGIALLGYLAVHAGTWFTREVICDLLWPQLTITAARSNLRQVLNNLDGLLLRSEALLNRNGNTLALAPGLDTDIALLSDATLARIAADTPAARQWRERDLEPWAAHLCREFLSGLQLSDTPEFDAWLDAQRLHFKTRALLVLDGLCRAQHREGRLKAAIQTARHLVASAPLDDDHNLLLMSLLAEAGNGREAISVFDTLRQGLAAEMGVEPAEALIAMHKELEGRVKTAASPSRLNAGESEVRQIVALYCVSHLAEAENLEDFRTIVDMRGGTVVAALGRGLLAAFGLDHGAERAAQRALLAARDLVSRGDAGSSAPRIGISAGRVLLRLAPGMPLLAGETPDVAKLLGWEAQPGEIMVSEPVALQAGEWFRFEFFGERSYSGIEATHRLYRLAGAASLVSACNAPLAGRDDELALLNGYWNEAVAGRRKVVFVRAPAGFGKTRLAGSFADQVSSRGGNVRHIRCRLEHQHEPLAPVLAEFGTVLDTDGGGVLPKSAILGAIIASLKDEIEDSPTLMVVDDLHWSDRATLEFLAQLVHDLEAQNLLMIVTTRPDVPFDLSDDFNESIELLPLEEADALSLIAAHDPANAIPSEERIRIARICAGVPLFIERQVKSRIEGGHHHLSIVELLQNELDQLGTDKHVLYAAALLGNRFERRHLSALLPGVDVDSALARSVDRQLIDPALAGAFLFRHALIQDTAYCCLPIARRKQLHERCARILIAEPDVATEEVAQHFSAAECRDEAVVWWLKAGETQMATEFAADAVVSFGKALEQLELPESAAGPAQMRAVRVRLGHAAQVADGYGSPLAYRLFTGMVAELEVVPERDNEQLFSVLSGWYMGSSSFGKDEGIAIAERLHALACNDAQRLMSCFALGNTLFWLGRFEEALDWQRQCIALAGTVPLDDRLRYSVDDSAATARAVHGWTLWFLGDEAAACAASDEALAVARKGGRAHGLCFALIFAACMHWCRGDAEQVGILTREALALAKRHQFPLWEGVAGLLLLWAQARSGHLVDQSELFGAAKLLQQALPSRVTTSRWIVLYGLLALDEWDEMEGLLETTLREIESQEEQYCLADLVWLKSRCLLRRREVAEARRHRQKALDIASAQGARGLSARFV